MEQDEIIPIDELNMLERLDYIRDVFMLAIVLFSKGTMTIYVV